MAWAQHTGLHKPLPLWPTTKAKGRGAPWTRCHTVYTGYRHASCLSSYNGKPKHSTEDTEAIFIQKIISGRGCACVFGVEGEGDLIVKTLEILGLYSSLNS